MATVTKTTTAVIEGNIYSAGMCHWSDVEDMDTCGSGAGNISGVCVGWMYSPICTDFDFALLSTDIITSIEVSITGSQDGTSYLDYCSLMYNGTPAPFHCFQADSVNPLDATSHTLTFQPTSSGDPDLWGTTWTAAMVNDPTFGCAFDGWHDESDAINIDCVQITITYTPGGEEPTGICEGIPCDLRLTMDDMIKMLVTKYTGGGEGREFECIGMKMAPALAKCEDLTDISVCGTHYTLEQILRDALVGDGCGGWSLRVWVIPPSDWQI